MKLEALLANAGIESITSDLFKDPQIMQTLTNTYVKTINEVVTKTANLKSSLSSSSSCSSFNKMMSSNNNNNNNNNTNTTKNHTNKTESKKNNKKISSDNVINDVVGTTFEEFILAAAAVAAATAASSSGGGCVVTGADGIEHDLDLDDEDALNSLEENFGIKPSSRRQLVKCLENFHFNHVDHDDDDEIDDLDDQNDSDVEDEEDNDEEEEDDDDDDDDGDENDDKDQEQKIALLLNTNSLLQQITSHTNNKNDKLFIKNEKRKYSSHKYINENKIHDCIDNLTSPESLLTKLIEFKSNITSNDLEKIR